MDKVYVASDNKDDNGAIENADFAKNYNQKYYERNKERHQAYNREYSAKVRADPVKREILNEKKREMMRRLTLHRREFGITPPPSKKRESHSDCSSGEKVRRRDHRVYYEKNKEAMRKSNSNYSKRVRADPEKRAILNEKKKLAMRRLKERRRLEQEAAAQGGSLKQDPEEGDTSSQWPEPISSPIPATQEIETTSYSAEEEEIVYEEVYYDEEVVPEPEDETKEDNRLINQDVVKAESSELTQGRDPMEVTTEDILPFTISVYRAIAEEDRASFLAYMEECAQRYYEHNTQLQEEHIED